MPHSVLLTNFICTEQSHAPHKGQGLLQEHWAMRPICKRGAPHLIQHSVQLVAGLAYAVAVVAVHHEDEALGVLEVVPPQGADLHRGMQQVIQEAWA